MNQTWFEAGFALLENLIVFFFRISKFQTDWKKWEDKIDYRRALDEAEKAKATRNQKLMADISTELVQCLEASLHEMKLLLMKKLCS